MFVLWWWQRLSSAAGHDEEDALDSVGLGSRIELDRKKWLLGGGNLIPTDTPCLPARELECVCAIYNVVVRHQVLVVR